MRDCILCENIGKEREFFFKDKPLCKEHYIEYLEYLINEMQDEVTPSYASSALSKLRLSLKSKYILVSTPNSSTKTLRKRR